MRVPRLKSRWHSLLRSWSLTPEGFQSASLRGPGILSDMGEGCRARVHGGPKRAKEGLRGSTVPKTGREGAGGAVGGDPLSRSAHRRVWEGLVPRARLPPGVGLGSSQDPPPPHPPALAASAHRRARVLPLPPFAGDRTGPGAAAETQCAGRAGLPADARRPGCGGAIYSARASRGRRGRDQRATLLVVTPTPAA